MWSLVKFPKGLALVAFLLPWLTVSCHGQPLAKATGYGLAFGDITTFGEAAGKTVPNNPLLIAAICVIAVGLALAIFLSRKAAIPALLTSVAALGLTVAGTLRYSRRTIADAIEASGQPSSDPAAQFGRSMLDLIEVHWQVGYYITLGSLVVAIAMCVLVLMDPQS